jgi:hypothetical protein
MSRDRDRKAYLFKVLNQNKTDSQSYYLIQPAFGISSFPNPLKRSNLPVHPAQPITEIPR